MENSEKTKIKFVCDGKPFVLEITANALKKAERAGINMTNLSNMPFTAPETVFWIACIQNQPTVSQKQASKIYKSLKRTADNMEAEYDEDGSETDALTDTLIKMLNEASEEFMGRQGNVGWSVI